MRNFLSRKVKAEEKVDVKEKIDLKENDTIEICANKINGEAGYRLNETGPWYKKSEFEELYNYYKEEPVKPMPDSFREAILVVHIEEMEMKLHDYKRDEDYIKTRSTAKLLMREIMATEKELEECKAALRELNAKAPY